VKHVENQRRASRMKYYKSIGEVSLKEMVMGENRYIKLVEKKEKEQLDTLRGIRSY
jgi:hypothetical protein